MIYFATSPLIAGATTASFTLPIGENAPHYYALIVRRDPDDPNTRNQPASTQIQQLASDNSTWITVETFNDSCIGFVTRPGEARVQFRLDPAATSSCRIVGGGVSVPWCGVVDAGDQIV